MFLLLIYRLYLDKLNLTIIDLLIIDVIAIAINYCLFKGNKHQDYFKEFNHLSRKKRLKYSCLSFLFFISSFIFLLISFVFMDYLLKLK